MSEPTAPGGGRIERMTSLSAGAAAGLGCAALFALAGLADGALRGKGLAPTEALATVGLWLGLGSGPALAASLAAALLARVLPNRLPGRRSALLVVCAALQMGLLMGLSEGFVKPVAAAAGVGLGLLVFWLAPRDGRGLGRAALLLIAASLLAAPLLARGRGALPAISAGEPGGGGRTHVVLIVLDTLRADHLGAYGHGDGLSPDFDALATESTLFESCFATAPWTVPSHASLFTGLHSRSHGAHFEQHRWLDDEFTTLAEALSTAGYRTAGFSANDQLELANLHQGFDVWTSLGAPFRDLAARRALQTLGGPARWTDEGAADGLRRIDDYLAATVDDPRPLFLFVNWLEPHWRYMPPLADRLARLPADMGWLEATRRASAFYGPLAMAGPPVTEATAAAVRALYAGEVRYQDRRLGQLLHRLDARLDLDRTLLVVTADHGENLGEAGRWDHVFAVNDHLIRVPLLVRQPGRFEAGARVEGLCSLLDVSATVAGAVGGLDLGEGEGRNLAPRPFRARRVVFAEGDPYYGHLERMSLRTGFQRDVSRFTDSLTAVRDRRFKYVVSSRDGGVLYDLERDPDETRDVSVEHPQPAERLRARLREWTRATPRYRGEVSGPRPLGSAERDRLRALGYLE